MRVEIISDRWLIHNGYWFFNISSKLQEDVNRWQFIGWEPLTALWVYQLLGMAITSPQLWLPQHEAYHARPKCQDTLWQLDDASHLDSGCHNIRTSSLLRPTSSLMRKHRMKRKLNANSHTLRWKGSRWCITMAAALPLQSREVHPDTIHQLWERRMSKFPAPVAPLMIGRFIWEMSGALWPLIGLVELLISKNVGTDKRQKPMACTL